MRAITIETGAGTLFATALSLIVETGGGYFRNQSRILAFSSRG